MQVEPRMKLERLGEFFFHKTPSSAESSWQRTSQEETDKKAPASFMIRKLCKWFR